MNFSNSNRTIRMNIKSGKTRILTTAVLSIFLTACGDSDLEQLHSDRIRQVELGATHSIVENISDDRNGVAEIISSSTLVFADEFEGAEIDATKWNTRYNWGPDAFLIDEQQYYVDTQNSPDFGYNPFEFDGDVLSITVQSTPEDLVAAAKGQPYLSGVLTTSGKFDHQFGYIEIRARMPAGDGLWPSFFLLGAQNIDLKPQLFVVESRGNDTQTVYHRYNHADSAGDVIAAERIASSGADFTANFHTYGVAWSENKLTFFVDGVRRHTIASENVAKQNMYLLLNFAVGGAFAGVPNENTLLPAKFEIDYVRVYHRDQAAAL